MLKNITKLEFAIGDKFYHLMCDMDAPIDHIKVALGEFYKYVQAVDDSNKAKQAVQACESCNCAKKLDDQPQPVEQIDGNQQ